MSQIEFYDAAESANIPSGAHAALAADGIYAPMARQQAHRFAAVRWITVLGGADAAAYAGILDYETGNEAYTPERLRAWAQQRRAMNCRARVYCNRSDFPAAQKAVEGLNNIEWWIATLDGDKLSPSWTPGMWGVQFDGGVTARYDISVLYGDW